MQTASVQTQTDPEICNDALRDQHNEALALFRKGTQRLKQSRTDDPRIIEAKQMLYEADGMCKQVDFFLDCLQQVPAPEPVLRAGAALPASARVVDAAGKPNAMAVDDDKSRIILVGAVAAGGNPNAMAVADDKSRIILVGAVAAGGNPNAMAVTDDKSRSIRGGPAPSDAGTKPAAAPLAKPDIVQLLSSDEEPEPKRPCLSKPAAAAPTDKAPAGGVAKAPPEVVYAFKEGVWHNDVYKLQCELAGIGKFNFNMLRPEAEKQLGTLPYEVALVLLGKIRDEKQKIRNVNAFIVKNAIHLRNQYSLDDAKTVNKQIQNIDDTDSESGDD
jgi:hypothetical protein